MIDFRLGDCLDMMGELPGRSVDLVLADLPYGTTACRWDSVIPFEPLWGHYQRLLKPAGAVVLTACQPFTSMLVLSNPRWFRYEWVWDKVGRTGFLDAKRRPLRRHESVLVFARGRTKYHPQMEPGSPYRSVGREGSTGVYRTHVRVATSNDGQRYPTSILRISSANFKIRRKVHPTQKPVALMEYLIRTYTDPGDLVLDNCMGSGTTGVACLGTGRRFIGIEKDPGYFALARRRIESSRLLPLAQ